MTPIVLALVVLTNLNALASATPWRKSSKTVDDSTKSILLIGGVVNEWSGGTYTKSILSFSPSDNCVTNWTGGPLKSSLGKDVADKIGDKIIVAGFTEIYDPAVGKFVGGPWMKEKRDSPVGAVNGNSIFVCGGMTIIGLNQFKFHDTCEKFSFETNKWETLKARMPMGVFRAAAVSFGNHIYIFGGSSSMSSGVLNSVQRYNVRTKQWTEMAPMISPRAGAKAAVWKCNKKDTYDCTVMVCGGYSTNAATPDSFLSSCESYKSKEDKWSPGPSMNEKKWAHGLVSFHGTLFSLGGRPKGQISDKSDNIEKLQEDEDGQMHWVTLKEKLPKGRTDFLTVVY